jgi:hypothetical protein
MHTTIIQTDTHRIVINHHGDWGGDVLVRVFATSKPRVMLTGDGTARCVVCNKWPEYCECATETKQEHEFKMPGWILRAIAKKCSDERLKNAVINLVEQWRG